MATSRIVIPLLEVVLLITVFIFLLGQSHRTIRKPQQLLKAKINSGDHHKSAEAMKLSGVPANEFNCLGSRNEINQKRIKEEWVLYGTWCAHAAVDCRNTGAGRFADPTDSNCKNYTLCIYLKNDDSYISHKAVCPRKSVFDPKSSKCTSRKKYTCKSRITIKTNLTCTYEGFVADPDVKNCSSYIQCANSFGTFTQLRQACPINTYFNPNTSICETNYRCDNSIAAKNQPEQSKICTDDGYIPDPEVKNCSSYIQCVGVFGNFTQLRQTCPSNTYFNPKTTLCEPNYRCNNRIAAKNQPKMSIICTYDGFIPDPEVKNCSTYIQCVNTYGTFTQLRHSCPNNTYFNPNTTLCETNYRCVKFRCWKPGRIADTLDHTCRKYFYCVRLNNGTFALFNYSCPGDSMFDPGTTLCTTEYSCMPFGQKY